MGKGDDWEDDGLNGRMCIVSRQSLPAERMIRFVLGPDGAVVPDLKRNLPGRGAHVEARREAVEIAVRRNLFRRAFKGAGKAGEDLPAEVDMLLSRSVLGALGLARKAGQVATGAAKVEAELRAGRALALLQASDGAPDGRRKMESARYATMMSGRAERMPVHRLFTADEMGLALGGANVVHAAVLAGSAGAALLRRLQALESYRGLSPAEPDADRADAASNETRGPATDAEPCMDGRLGTTPGQEAEA